MSTPPPPPPFGYPGQSGGPSSQQSFREQRRAAAQQTLLDAAQRRNMRQQARIERDRLRLQMRAARRSSIVGPLLLVALGTVLLLLQLGRLSWPGVMAWFGRWWPAVLIASGLVMILEWTLDRMQASSVEGQLPVRRTLGGGTAALLIFLAVIGAGIMTAENGSAWARRNLGPDFDHNFQTWPQLFGARSEFTETLQAAVAPDGSLTINAPHGDITVTGSSQDGQVHVNVHQQIYGWPGRDIEAHHRAEQVQLSGDRQHLTVSAPMQDQDSTDLTVEVPRGVSLTVRNEHGALRVEELHAAADLTARDGDVKLTAITGPVHLVTADDDADITAHSLAGGLTLTGRTGDISLTNIDGPVLLHGDFFGTTHLEHIRGTVHFQSSYTDLACAGIPGDLDVEGRSDLRAQRLDGPVALTTTDRNITLDGVRGGATVEDRNGSVSLNLAAPAQPVQVSNSNGSVQLTVPRGAGVEVEARTRNGQIHDQLGLTSTRSGEVSTAAGEVRGGGPLLRIDTTEGDITLSQGSTEFTTDWDEAPQRITPGTAPSVKNHAAARSATR